MPRSARCPSQPVCQRKSSRGECGERRVRIDLRVRVLEGRGRRARRSQHRGKPQPLVVGVHRRVPAIVGHELDLHAPLAVVSRHEVHHVVVVGQGASGRATGVLAAQARIDVLEIAEVHVRRQQLDRRLFPDPGEGGRGGDPHRLAVGEIKGALLGEHVAAARPEAGERQALEGPAVRRLQSRRRTLRPQVAVPDHLGEAHRHGEPARVESQPRTASARRNARSRRASCES